MPESANLRSALGKLWLLGLAVLVACAPGAGPASLLAGNKAGAGFPPDRSAFAKMEMLDRGIHLQTVVAALEDPAEDRERGWTGNAARGGVTVADTYLYRGALLCRAIRDRVEIGGRSVVAVDAACWDGARWVWLRDSDAPPAVLAPVRGFPTYVVRSGGTLAAVARRKRVRSSVLERLNPQMTRRRLKRGERVLLPPG